MADKVKCDDVVLQAIFNPNLPSGEGEEETNGNCAETENGSSNLHKEVNELEVAAVKAAEAGDFETSMMLFSQAINLDPEYASTYNNRAQLKRLKGDIEGSLEDLERAITFSHGHGKAASQAYTQRGLVRRLRGDDENALEDFKKAALLGNSFAKAQVVKMNPYAAMCNQMLTDVIGKLVRGETDALQD